MKLHHAVFNCLRRQTHRQWFTGITLVIALTAFFSVQLLLLRPSEALTEEPATVCTRQASVNDVTVTAEYEKGILPEDVQLVIKEIDSAPYAEILEALADTRDKECKTYDISFVQQEEIMEPQGDVRITFQASYINEETKPEVIHLSEEPEVMEDTDLTDGALTMTTDSFSVYAIVYTVEFHYEVNGANYSYVLEGSQSCSLHDVLTTIQVCDSSSVDEFMQSIETVTVSDPKLLSVEQTGSGEWMITSNQPFNTDEQLFIAMKDGQTFTIGLSDDAFYDLRTAASSISADVTGNDEGIKASYRIDDQGYLLNLNLHFYLSTDTILEDTAFDLPFERTITIPQNLRDQTFTVYDKTTQTAAFTYQFVQTEDGICHLQITYLSEYISDLKTTYRQAGESRIEFQAIADKTAAHEDGSIIIPVSGDLTVTVSENEIQYPDNGNESNDITLSKRNGTYDKETNKLSFTLTVSSKYGTTQPITISDILTVTSGTLDLSAITIDSITRNNDPVTGYETIVSLEDYQFVLSGLPALNASEQYTIQVSYELSDEIHQAEDFSASGTNTATVTVDTVTDHAEQSWTVTKESVSLKKQGTYQKEEDSIQWTITVTNNKQESIDLQDDQLILLEESDITVTDENGQTIDRYEFNSFDGKLIIPPDTTYNITYSQIVDPNEIDPAKDTAITNTVTAGDHETTAVVSIPAEVTISKDVVSESTVENNIHTLTWRVTIHVPEAGLKRGTAFTDTLSFVNNGDVSGSHVYNDMSTLVYFSDAQKEEIKTLLLNTFSTALEEEDIQFTETADHRPQLYFTLSGLWNGDTANGISYRGKDLLLEYSTTADTRESISDINTLTNTATINSLSASAAYTFSEKVTKKSEANKTFSLEDVTNRTLDGDDQQLHWSIQTRLHSDMESIEVSDTLPSGIKGITELYIGKSQNYWYEMYKLTSQDNGVHWTLDRDYWYCTGNTAESNTFTVSAVVENNVLTLTAQHTEGEELPSFFRESQAFYVYYSAEIDESVYPEQGETTVAFENQAEVSVDGSLYDSDTQTQNVTLITELLHKTLSTSHFNQSDGLHQLDYTVDINPRSAHLLYDDSGQLIVNGTLTLSDMLTYPTTVRDPDGNVHDVIVSLLSNHLKLQRESEGEWADIPVSEGWGYTYDEGTKDSQGNKTKTINLFGLPDETHLRLCYTYAIEVVDPGDNATYAFGAITNSAFLNGIRDSTVQLSSSLSWKKSHTSGETESSGVLTIVKVEAGNYAIPLPDALFQLEEYQGGSWKAIDAIGNSALTVNDLKLGKLYRTDSSGMIYITADPKTLLEPDSTSTEAFKKDVLYRIREVRAPNNYQLTEDAEAQPAGYFYFSDSKETKEDSFFPSGNTISRHADNLLYETDTVYLENEPVKGYELPDTGGRGILRYTLPGVFLTVVSIGLLIQKGHSP